MSKSRAAVLVEEQRLELDEFPLPKIGPDEGLLRVEHCGLCGTDVEVYDGAMAALGIPFGIIPGHEPVGIIEEVGENAAERWGVKQGSRVVVEPLIGCGHCRSCLTGNYRMCRTPREGTIVSGYSFIPTTTPPALWGAYSEYMYLDPGTVMHEVPEDLAPEVAALYQPVAAGHPLGRPRGGHQDRRHRRRPRPRPARPRLRRRRPGRPAPRRSSSPASRRTLTSFSSPRSSAPTQPSTSTRRTPSSGSRS